VKEEGEEETQKSRMKRKKNNWLIILAKEKTEECLRLSYDCFQ
jgi:hypothetical protein